MHNRVVACFSIVTKMYFTVTHRIITSAQNVMVTFVMVMLIQTAYVLVFSVSLLISWSIPVHKVANSTESNRNWHRWQNVIIWAGRRTLWNLQFDNYSSKTVPIVEESLDATILILLFISYSCTKCLGNLKSMLLQATWQSYDMQIFWSGQWTSSS